MADDDEAADGEPAPQPEQPQVTIAADGDVTEGEAVSFTVTAMPAPAMDLMVNVTVTETGATLAAPVPENVTIAAGETTAMLQVSTVDDTTDEFHSTVTAMVNDGTGYTIGSSNSAEVTVADNDGGTSPTLPPGTPDLPQVTIRASQARVTEGEAVSFTVTANPAPAADLVVSVTVAETGDTLAAPVPQEVTIAAGRPPRRCRSPPSTTLLDESDSTVTATVNSGTGYTVGSSRFGQK